MELKNTLPKNYIPLNELIICSNKLLAGAKLIGIDEFAPILIGDGVIPSIWIFAKNQNHKWVEIIKESINLQSSIKIITDKINREIVIGIQGTIILKGRMTSDKVCEINAIDLRPVGFDIHGNENEFHIANTTFSRSTFQLNGFLVGFSEKQKEK